MDPRLAGFTQRLQSIPGAPVSPEEIAERVQYLYDRLRGQTPAPLSGTQSGGGQIPVDLATRATRELFSNTGAFPQKGGANFLETLAQNPQAQQAAQEMAGKAAAFAQSPKGQQMLGQAQDIAGKGQQMLGQAQGLAGQAQGLMKGLAGGIPRAQGPTLESFLESLGVPQIPVKGKKVPGDFLGNAARWWVKAASSPYLGTLVKLTFFFMFFISFLESTPLIGRVVSVALDVILAGGRIVVKILQKGLPALVGLIPLPYMQLSATILVSVIGMFVWTILATISFGRQDFTSAIESMLRIIPIPVGDAMADAFLDVNRTVDQFNEKRIKLTDDVWNGMLLFQQFLARISTFVSGAASSAFQRIQSGADKLLNAIQGVRGAPAAAAAAVPMAAMAIPTATPVPEPVPVAAPMATPIPTATPVPPAPPAPSAPPIDVAPAPAAPPVPTAPPVDVPPAPSAPPVAEPAAPVPTAPPVDVPPAPSAPPVAEPAAPVAPAPVAPAPVAEPAAPVAPAPVAPAPVAEPAAPVAPAPVAEAAAPVPTAPVAPAPVAPAPVAEPAAPVATPPPTFEMGPQPAQSPLERLRNQKTAFTAPKQLRGGKRLSTKTRRSQKWKTHPMYERFSGLGLR